MRSRPTLRSIRSRAVQIERVEACHLADIAEIEKLCFAFPWSENALALLTKEGAVGFAAICDGRVAAYGGMLCVLDEGQITNVATHPELRRRGYAKEVMRALIDYAKGNGINTITLEVRASNARAISMYEDLGFYRVGERKNFYKKPIEAAVLMQKDI
ncbi:MAG: ribosomal-protein-alanine N-acetyltransferase [Ruminococcaceae bacterium]|nr:ribosomal-protein-alanine N-acetyltransferase [Oscillospiraceae bacterium]